MQRFFGLTIIVFASLLLGAAASAGKKEDILALQQKVVQLEQQLGSLSQKTGQTDADATLKINQLQRENQELTGRVEALSNQVRQMSARLDQVTRILAGENFSGLDGASTPGTSGFAGPGVSGGVQPLGVGAGRDPVANDGPVSLSGAPADGPASVAGALTGEPEGVPANASNGVALPADPDTAYAYASNFILQGDYIRARQAFEQFVQTYPNSPYTPDAQFRLGEIYLATGANADAAQAFIKHIQDYPNDPKGAEAYLKLGTAFARMEQTDQACQIFKQVKVKFPNASSIILSRTELEMQRINCR